MSGNSVISVSGKKQVPVLGHSGKSSLVVSEPHVYAKEPSKDLLDFLRGARRAS